MYPEDMVAPMRQELVDLGFEQLRTVEEVDAAMGDKTGTTLLVVNSVCGCAAGNARPGVRLALGNDKKPDKLVTVFAGNDGDATNHARGYITGYPPSSPAMCLFKDGQVAVMLERYDIEGHTPEQIATALINGFDKFCS